MNEEKYKNIIKKLIFSNLYHYQDKNGNYAASINFGAFKFTYVGQASDTLAQVELYLYDQIMENE